MAVPQWAHRAAAQTLANGADATWLHHMLDFIDARIDLADQRLMVVLALRLSAADDLPDELREAIDRSLIGFRYALEDSGEDSMCTWTENHQLLFAVGEYLAGDLLPETRFSQTGMVGATHRERARRRLLRWLEDRFRWGFSEWLSGTYYELDVAALTLLIEHCHDDDLCVRATMVLDLLMLDLALHRFETRFVSSSGRAYRKPTMDPARAEINVVLASAFGQPPLFDPQTLSSIFVARSRYVVPQAIVEIAQADGAHSITTSHGRSVDEVVAAVTARHRSLDDDAAREDLVRSLWAMQAFTLPDSVAATIEAFRRLGLERNRYLAPMTRFKHLSPRLARTTLAVLNPITRGMALQRANVLTHRTPHHLLSSAQSYLPGEFGDQQHLWHAALPGDICVFGTHPGSTTLGSDSRPATPSAWVGNGVNPDVAQVSNVVLVLHDVRGRKGYLEGSRHELSHLFFPFAKFDETTLTESVVTGRKDDSFIGIAALGKIEMVSEDELLQRDPVTGWAVVLSDRGEYSSLHEFTRMMKAARLRHRRDTLRFEATLALGDAPRSAHRIDLRWRQGFRVDGIGQNTNYPRYESPWVTADRGARAVTIVGRESRLRLDWTAGTRSQE